MENSNIPKLIEEIEKNKKIQKEELDQIKYRHNKKAIRIKKDELVKQLPQVKSKSEVYEDMKNRFRMAWKSPGYVNKEFSNIPVMKATVLREWDQERIYLAERSYKAPKNFRGFKNTFHGQEFGETGTKYLPKEYVEYLETVKDKYNDFRFKASKYGKIQVDRQLEKLKLTNKQPFGLVNSVQSNMFGFDKHNAWEAEVKMSMLKQNYSLNNINKNSQLI